MIHPILGQEVFSARRASLLEKLPEGSTVILYAAPEAERNGDVTYPFRQNSYFWYLTGFPEPNAIAVINKKNGHPHYTLYSAARDPIAEIWSGKIIGQENAENDYAVNTALPLTGVHQTLPEIAANSTRLYTILGTHPQNDSRINKLLREAHLLAGRGGAPIEGIFDLRRIIDEMRLVKSIEEQNLLHEAGRISAKGHTAAILAARAGAYEYTVQAALEAEFRRHRGCHWSFPSIVASGKNACCLHYRDNNAPLKDGDLILVDAGAEYAGYAGDITRTAPINGKFNREQQALYEVVLHAQKEAIKSCRAGIRHLELHKQTSILLMQGLIDLDIVSGDALEIVESGEVKRFYPHGTGHWLGLDVHDVGVYQPSGESRKYIPGMVVTIEPGIYLQPNDLEISEQWRGIGIRIEDDVIITEGEPEVTTADVPKDIRDIESLLSGRK
ncbi:aminopeptidase P N-terminal domain-containing protein [Suttonella ornithocola]|uniref:Xaa-Pro aminopeptidase n=1 Tax=Suttonella ornithocola TaxID=279832 RepID=A0A380MTG0_9GAMM|nr:aminopeptidase P N-terminal domain-containing protein [Suttonella ornithocola]SUO95880.1 Xaa-Pro aminopeptidase [Suttonella ornithocola]